MPFAPPDGSICLASRTIAEGRSAVVLDPWSGAEVGRAILADDAIGEEAIAGALRGFETLRECASYERKALLARIAGEIESRREAFAELIAREAGKPIAMARAEVARAVATFQLGAEEATRIEGASMALDGTPASRGYSGTWTRVPAGPVLAIAPFNFPLNLVAHKVSPALACGCSVVLKPAPQAPLTALLLAECIRVSGAPEGAVSVLPRCL